MTLEKKPDFRAIETKWQKWWNKNKIYKFDSKSKKPIFTNDTPPPTISGRLHIGHALNYTLFDFVARYKRMAGFNVFYPIGWDDNGQPTERYVEKKLGIKSKDISRAKFNKIVTDELKEAEKLIEEDSIAFGMSYDWSTLYKTISQKSIKAAQASFLDLHKKNLVYRAEEPMLWCPHCQTALSQADIEDKKRITKLNYIKFKLENGKTISIATTRSELLPACVGIFVHPDDKRYKKLVGKKATVPLFGHKVPIMADNKVDPKFGTGIVMICTFGDTTDIEWFKKHKLPLRIAVTKEGKLNKLAGKYEGLTLAEARKKIIVDLEAKGLLQKQEKLEQTVGTCWRCHDPTEYLVTKQWLVKLLANKKKFIEQGRKVKWHPAFFRARYEDWVKNLGWDWVISRQRHFGVPIPVWYCKGCEEIILPDVKDLPIDPEKDKPKRKCKCKSQIIPEHDVFDTWMTSSLTPEIALGWPDKKLSSKFFPMDLRSSGHDIIRTWAFYTIVKAYYHFKKLPWKHVMINGMVLDPKGKPMHKSLGNVIAPREMVKKYNSDSLRYWAASVTLGEDIPFQEKELARGMKIVIKLWNTARFVEMHLKKPKKAKLEIIDKWILSRLAETVDNYKTYFENYQPSKARKEIEMFFLHEFADFYLEMIKYRLYGNKQADAARWTLYQCLLAILKMWAPFIPHITEEIYQNMFKTRAERSSAGPSRTSSTWGTEKDKSIHLSSLPKKEKVDKKALELGKLAVEAIMSIRKYKADNNMSMGAEIEKLTFHHKKTEDYKKVADVIKGTMRIKELVLKKGALKVK